MNYTFQTGKGLLVIDETGIRYGDDFFTYETLENAVYSYGISIIHLSFKDGSKENIWLIHADLKVAREAEKMIRSHITDAPAPVQKEHIVKEEEALFSFDTPHGKLRLKNDFMTLNDQEYRYADMKKAFYIVGSSVLNVTYKHKKRDLFWLQHTDLKTAREAERFIQKQIKKK
ncbi:MAG: hypothetical protein ACSW8B_06085 [bacterium]